MKTTLRRSFALLALAAAATLPAHAHRAWMLPSATVLSGKEPWVTIDAAVSNDLFYFEHQPMRLDGLDITAPDGSKVKAENAATGRYRSTFDVKLAQQGTWRIAIVNRGMFASFKVGTETKRLRGTAESLAKEIPANATELNVTQNLGRIEVFVTAGKPTTQALAPTGEGLEMVPVTHPNDLVVGGTAKFRFVLDGKPAANLAVTVIPGGIRYRDKLHEESFTTDAEGEIAIKWATPGMHWIEAAPPRPAGGPGGAGGPGAAAPRPQGPAGTLAAPIRRASYVATVEVLPE